MNAALPGTLYRAKRGLCPGCGSPLPLDDDSPSIACGFCGQEAVLERRLRKVEPEFDGAPLRLFFDAAAAEAGVSPEKTPWLRTKRFRQAVVERTVCPGCGDSLEIRDDDVLVHCASCGTDSRFERRLWAPLPDPATEVPRPRHPDERHLHCGPDDADAETEHLIFRIVNETDIRKRINLAWKLSEDWRFANKTTARLLPTLLQSIRGADPALQYAVPQIVCKLLCEGSPELRNAAVRAAERFVFDLDAPRPLIFAVGMGDAVCLKLLLDVAELATRKGDLEYACAALLGVMWVFERNYGQHEKMGEILMYRLLYLTGPVLAFAFILAQRGYNAFYFKAEPLLRFIDEAAVERPGLLPELDRSFYVGLPKDEAEARHRLAFYETLESDAARECALRHYVWPPEQASDALYRDLASLYLGLLDHPSLAKLAEVGLKRLVDTPPSVPQVVHDLVSERGDSLPAEMRRAYFRVYPNTKLLTFSKLPYWESEKEPGLTPELQRARDQWKEGVDRACAVNDADRRAFHEVYKTLADSRLEIFDGVSDGSPPPKPKPEAPRPQSTFDLGVVNASDLQTLIEKLVRDQAEAMKRMGG